MDASRVSGGEKVAGAGGLLLFLSLFLSWFEGSSAWSFFNVIPVELTLLSLAIVGLVIARALGVDLGVPRALLPVLGGIALVIVFTLLLEIDGRGLGVFLAFLSSVGVVVGGLAAMNEVRGARPSREPRPAGSRSGGPS